MVRYTINLPVNEQYCSVFSDGRRGVAISLENGRIRPHLNLQLWLKMHIAREFGVFLTCAFFNLCMR